MTVQGLYKEVVERPEFDLVDDEPKHHLSSIPAGTWHAIDISILLYRALARVEAARQFAASPKVPLTIATKLIMTWIEKAFIDHDQHIIAVFDGINNPLKKQTDQKRKARRDRIVRELSALYQRANEQDLAEVEKRWKQLIYPRGDFILDVKSMLQKKGIPVMQAPYEAEAQCVALQKANLVEYIVSEDGDVFALGASKWITNLNYFSGRCCILHAAEICKRESAGDGKWNDFLPAIPAFRGCDYNCKLYKLDFHAEMEAYVRSPDKRAFLEDLERRHKWPPKAAGEERGLQVAIGFADIAQCTMRMFESHPVWALIHVEGLDINLNDRSSYTVELAPLNDRIEYKQDPAKWGQGLGFEMSPQDVLASKGIGPEKYENMCSLEIWGRSSGGNIQDQRIPYPRFQGQYHVMHGAVLNVDVNEGGIPLVHTSSQQLIVFLRENRWLPMAHGRSRTISRKELLENARHLFQRRRETQGQAPRPRSLDEARKDSGTFSFNQVLAPLVGAKLTFTQANVKEKARSVLPINDAAIDKYYFKKKRNGVRYRAQRRIDGGHYDIGTFSVADVIIKDTGKGGLLFRCFVIPSQKADSYWSYLAYDDQGRFFPYPATQCECPVVKECSHFLGLVGGPMYLAQQYPEWTVDDLKNAMPVPVTSFQSLPVPWEMGHFSHSQDEAKVKAQGRTALAYYEMHGARERDTEDDRLENEAQNEEDDLETPTHCICAHAQAMVQMAKERATLKGDGVPDATTFMHSIDVEQIRDENKKKLNGYGGPNESIAAKRDQLDLHERLHRAASNSKVPKSLLSHYAAIYEPTRKRLLKQLDYLDEADVGPIRKKTRLNKISRDHSVMGDKAFICCAPLYPNYNEHLCPHVLPGGTQFPVETLEADEPVKSMRYSSEAVFSRETDNASLQDRVPRSFFPYLHHAINWAHGAANLYEPFRLPADGDYFDDLQEDHAEKKKARKDRKQKRVEKKKADVERVQHELQNRED